ncbi:carboxypeptidase-like regulatory domain-containing protein [uncultured Desulfosarcina sp.]|uniref:carboxypeptidase-like regulatory domain-containing protein n=1 Tax=uncultured Desulfosarcina sp. TaxID=218289 RepID=UPI0029C7779C|nr:carboxypeptidase-like regulatory domain-containing protein [uncultured Desulfosarcina sp.]
MYVQPPHCQQFIRRAIRWAVLSVILSILCAGSAPPVLAMQGLLGSLCITDESGQRIYGQYLSVFLTSQEIPVPQVSGLEEMETHRRLDRINQMHLDFYKQFAQHRNQPGYLIAHTESSDTGNFAFLDVPVGNYYVVVMFPAMIGGYKVAWQQPVSVIAGRMGYVSLDIKNLAIPADRRDFYH